jgi:hypothetical protein
MTPEGLRWAADYDSRRPRLIQIFNAKHVTLSGPLLTRSGFWTVHICYSDDVHVDGVTIRNNVGGRGPSTDGIDIDSSKHVLVEHADISVNDDALCLKAGRDADGLRVNRPDEDIVVRDSTVRRRRRGNHHRQRNLGRLPQRLRFTTSTLWPCSFGGSVQVGAHARRLGRQHPHPRSATGGGRDSHPHHDELEPQL